MKPLRTFLLAALLCVVAFTPTTALAVDATFFGPIIPEECYCDAENNNGVESAPDWGCVMQIAQNGINFVVSMGIVIFTLTLVYAGAMYMASGTKPAQHTQAVKMMQNIVLGIITILSAWLIVDYVMKVLYNPGANGFGPWNSILAGGEPRYCLEVKEPPQAPAEPTGEEPGEEDPITGTGSGPNCPAANPSNMVAIPAAATQGETEYATQSTVDRFLLMRAAAAQDGIDLKVTDGYRSDAEQVQLWNQNGCADGSCDRDTARPCSLGGTGSNHNSGEALDISVGCSNGQPNCNTATYNWLKENGMRWNFRNSLPNDPVHWSPSGR